MSEAATPKFKRILLKLSGEALMGSDAVSYTHLDVYKRQAIV